MSLPTTWQATETEAELVVADGEDAQRDAVPEHMSDGGAGAGR